MKHKLRYFKSYIPWLLLILAMDVFAAMLLWLADVRIFQALFVFLVLMSALLFVIIGIVIVRREERKERAFLEFLTGPDESKEKDLMELWGISGRNIIPNMAEVLYKKQAEIEKADILLSEYEEYVETWAHEIKRPLSLLTLILDNQGEDLPKNLFFKLNYVRNQVQDNVSRILFYYRVRGEKKDYLLEEIDLKECLEDMLNDYEPLLKEKNIKVEIQKLEGNVFTDRRSFVFMISQIIDNAIKYSRENPHWMIFMETSENQKKVIFRDNGYGVKSCDLPHIFEKGFAGDSGNVRIKSTGMGLYLVKKLAEDLKIKIDVKSEWMQGFEITLSWCVKETLPE